MTYAQAYHYLARGLAPPTVGRPIKKRRNTWIALEPGPDGRGGGRVVIRYQGVAAVVIREDDTWELWGGDRRPTVRARLREFSPAKVRRARGQWWIDTGRGEKPFRDGTIVNSQGEIVGVAKAPPADPPEGGAKFAELPATGTGKSTRGRRGAAKAAMPLASLPDHVSLGLVTRVLEREIGVPHAHRVVRELLGALRRGRR